MPKPIFIVEGYKGGVGKSLVSVTLIEYCRKMQVPICIVETDTTNPDVDAIYEGVEVRCEKIDLDEKDGGGWIKLASLADEHPETMIISMKAGTKGSTERNKGIIADSLAMLKRPVNLFFVLGIQQQSVVLLSDAIELYPMANTVVAVKNLKNGDLDEFFNYDDVKANPEFGVVFKDVLEFVFPRIHARISLMITDQDKTIKDLLEGRDLKVGERAALQSWFGKICGFYDENRARFWPTVK